MLPHIKTVWISCFLFFIQLFVHAQELDLQSPIPVDTTIQIKSLDNGLKYYLRYNNVPEKRVELRLAVKAGSICETDQQKGLAHFVEHMCFNGTKNFKENELINALEEMGVKFGHNLNAYTSFDETVYQLQVPSDRSDLIDKAFQILEDWAHQVTFADKDIDDERGVIVEEWRLGLGADERMFQKYFPVIFKGSRYAERLPIGDMNIVKNAPYEELRKFYKEWYRPNLMAVFVVGDMPEKDMEEKVKKHFSGLGNPKNAPERIEYEVPDNKDPLISIVTDKEATDNVVQVFIKHPKKTETILKDYRDILIQRLYNGMINKRFAELRQDPDAPFTYAGSSYNSFIGPIDAYSIYASAKENEIESTLEVLLIENERVKRFGFTQGELDREKQALLVQYDQAAKEANKNSSQNLIDEYVRNFTEKEPIPGIHAENTYAQNFIPGITLEEINQLAHQWITDSNTCVVVMAPDKDGIQIPSEEDIKRILVASKQADITEYVDHVLDGPLLSEEPKGSRLFRRRDNPDFGLVELIFMNGAQVVLKPTDFQNDQIVFAGFSPGGTSIYTDEDYMSAMMAAGIISVSGLGEFDQISLNKKLSGNTAKISPYIAELFEGVNGSTAPKDLETMLQLNYLYFTNIRRDEEAFNAYISRIKNQVRNMKSNPVYAYLDTLYKVASEDNPRVVTIPTESQIEQINLNNAMYVFQDRFADASDFKFIMVGNFKVNEIIPMLEKYIGGLPSRKRIESWRDVSPSFPSGITEVEYAKNSEEQSRVNILMKGGFEWKFKERLHFAILTDILNIKLRESMREDQGGVYGIQLSSNASIYPNPRYSMEFVWGCSPDNVTQLINTVFEESNKIKANGPTVTDLNKVKETLIRERETIMKDNSYWLSILQNVYRQGDKLMTLDEYKKVINAVKIKDIRNVARKYIKDDHYVVGKLMPVPSADDQQ